MLPVVHACMQNYNQPNKSDELDFVQFTPLNQLLLIPSINTVTQSGRINGKKSNHLNVPLETLN